jgi:CHAT domain-containing protein
MSSDEGLMENELQNRKQINNAVLIFADPAKSSNPNIIRRSVLALIEARAWARAHNFVKDENEALWGLYRCYSNTQRRLEAIEVLQDLRGNLEKMRGEIKDVSRRANILNEFPRLFSALCELLYANNRFPELLDAMEGAKGRVLADVLVRKEGAPMADRMFSEPAKCLPGLMREARAHYLSYLVDDKKIYAVLVDKHGSTHATGIPIGKEALRALANRINPEHWQVSNAGFFGRPIAVPEQLSPLVEWLEPIAKTGLINQGDHICYCPDAELHLIPLHYVTFRGKPLVKHVSLSRVQGALALLTILQRRPARLEKFIAVQVPMQRDLGDAAKLTNLERVPQWLKRNLPGETLMGKQADIDKMVQHVWKQRLVHFVTHGTFPEKDEEWRDPNPHSGSGLLLARNGELPSSEAICNGRSDLLLTPEKVLKLDFSGSHVTLQACVSGLAKEGIGGDALGLEWAFMQAGAQSLLATHWNVPDYASADFSTKFYQKWLVRKTSRAEAWRATIFKLMDCQYSDDRPKPYYWAGFSLSGDWR